MNLGNLADKNNEEKSISLSEEESISHQQDKTLDRLVKASQMQAEVLKQLLESTEQLVEGTEQAQRQLDLAKQKLSTSTTGQLNPETVELHERLEALKKKAEQMQTTLAQSKIEIGESLSNIVFAEKETQTLSPRFLATTLSSYLGAIADIQHVVDEILAKPQSEVRIKFIKQESPISVSLDGAADAVQIVQDSIVPWRRKHTEFMALLQEQEKLAEIESKKAEILEKRASAAKGRAEAEKLSAEATKQHEETEKLKLENEKLRLDIHRAKIQLAIEVIDQLLPGISETEKVAYLVKLLPPLEVIIFSTLEVATITNTKDAG